MPTLHIFIMKLLFCLKPYMWCKINIAAQRKLMSTRVINLDHKSISMSGPSLFIISISHAMNRTVCITFYTNTLKQYIVPTP